MNHSAKGDFKSSLMNSSEGGFWVRKWSSFRFRGPFCKWRGFIVIVSAPSDQLRLIRTANYPSVNFCRALETKKIIILMKFNSRAESEQLIVHFTLAKKGWAKRSKKREAKLRVKISFKRFASRFLLGFAQPFLAKLSRFLRKIPLLISFHIIKFWLLRVARPDFLASFH